MPMRGSRYGHSYKLVVVHIHIVHWRAPVHSCELPSNTMFLDIHLTGFSFKVELQPPTFCQRFNTWLILLCFLDASTPDRFYYFSVTYQCQIDIVVSINVLTLFLLCMIHSCSLTGIHDFCGGWSNPCSTAHPNIHVLSMSSDITTCVVVLTIHVVFVIANYDRSLAPSF